jgi:hypothetical protein
VDDVFVVPATATYKIYMIANAKGYGYWTNLNGHGYIGDEFQVVARIPYDYLESTCAWDELNSGFCCE